MAPKEMDIIKQECPKRVRKEREAKGLNQAELAILLGVRVETVAVWEEGELPQLFELCHMEDLFQCSMNYLLGLSEEKVL